MYKCRLTLSTLLCEVANQMLAVENNLYISIIIPIDAGCRFCFYLYSRYYERVRMRIASKLIRMYMYVLIIFFLGEKKAKSRNNNLEVFLISLVDGC